MEGRSQPTLQLASRYLKLFVNRGAFTLQSDCPDAKGKNYYFRPSAEWFARRHWSTAERRLCPETILRHLAGRITLGLYAINPTTQRSKWVAVDADYTKAQDDLTALQLELKKDGVWSALERSRRGAHLWIFAAIPLLARDLRVYVCNISRHLFIPIKLTGRTEGIEVFPRQDTLDAEEFGNAIRGPLGIHRGAKGQRFWFDDAAPDPYSQIEFLENLPKVSEEQIRRLVEGLSMPADLQPPPPLSLPPYDPMRREFHILDHVPRGRRSGKDYRTRCPSCAQLGRDKENDNLAVCISDPRKYRCWAGCDKEEIRAALGRPIRRLWENRLWQPATARA